MKTREIVCEFYEYEGQCKKGREGTFRKKCQTCDLYKPRKGAKPARPDRRKKLREKYMKSRDYLDY